MRFHRIFIPSTSVNSDSVFKIENRSTASSDSYRFTYYAKLRKIAKEYLEYSLLPLQLYTSGIMYRIKSELEKNDVSYDECKKIIGIHSDNIADILGYKNYDAVITKDNIALI